ncbi:MAG: flippase-like domain-containing protein [Salinivirgaceae bacterium]|nr:flippase-like domain-containing protein [Salinivirgaceae bacterium]
MKKFINAIKYVLFLAIGVAIFYYIYKEVDLQTLKTQINNVNWWWIGASIAAGLASHITRSMRWQMLITSTGHTASLPRTFCSVMSMYFTNLIIPRGGEIVRCTALARTDNIPFAVLLGTVVVERTVDTVLMLALLAVVVLTQLDFLKGFFSVPGHETMLDKIDFLFSPWFWIIGMVAGIALILILWKFRGSIANIKWLQPVMGLIMKFWNGLKSIAKLKSPVSFIVLSVFIYVTYFLMLIACFHSFAPTDNLSFGAGVTTFTMGSLAMLAPVQGGIGPWHFMVYETLALYGVALADGKIFALISHTANNGFCLIVGAVCLVYLTLVGRKREVDA